MKPFNHFALMANIIDEDCPNLVEKTAFDAQANVQGMIRTNGQIDTGFMVNSVYVVAYKKRTSPGGARMKGQRLLPPRPNTRSKYTAYVIVGAEYGVYQNNGTRYQSGRPFFEPGINKTAPSFDSGFQVIRAKLERYR